VAGAGVTHHITLATLAGTAVGFMLVTKNGVPVGYARGPVSFIPSRQMSDLEYSYSQFPVQVAAIWAESSWQHGIGGITRKDNDNATRYFLANGYKVDVSEKGKIKLARNFPTGAAGTTYGLNDANPNQYVPSGFVKSGTQMWGFQGDYAYTWDFTNKNWDRGTSYAGTTGPRMFRNGTEWGGYVVAASWADDVGSGGSYTASDLPARYIYKLLADASWTQKAVSTTHPAYAKFFAVANSKLIMGYIADATAFSTLAAAIDSSQATITTTSGSDPGAGAIFECDSELMLYVGPWVSPFNVVRGYRGSVAASHLINAPVNLVTLNKNQIRTTSSTTPDVWASATNIGDSSSPITGMIGLDWDTASYLYVFKTDGVYNYDFTNVNKISNIGGPTNGRANAVWQGHVYFSKSGGGLYEIDPDTDNIVDVSFSIVLPQRTELHGEVVALEATADALYALVLDTANTKYHLLEGRQIDGNGNISWQHVGAVSYTTGTDENHVTLYHDTVPNGSAARDRIWAGIESTGSSLLPYMYPRASDQDVVYNDDDDSYSESIKEDYGMPTVPKRWHKVQLTAANLGSGANDHYMEVQYSLDGAAYAWFTNAVGGTASQDNSKITAATSTLYYPAGTDGKACVIKVKYYQGTTTTTSPELLDVTCTTQIRSEDVDMWTLLVDIQDGLPLLHGMMEYRSATALSSLRTWKGQSDEITFVDLDGTSYPVIVLQQNYKETLVGKEPGRRRRYHVQLTLVRIT